VFDLSKNSGRVLGASRIFCVGAHIRGAEGARIEAPNGAKGVGSGEGVSPLPSRLQGLGDWGVS